jgi:tyrosine-protein kinase Etk/Wzc
VWVPPAQKRAGALAALGELGALAGLSGSESQQQAELCVGVLNSRVVADTIIERYHLKQTYRAGTDEDTRTRLADLTDVGVAKSGILSIAVTDTDPQRAAAIANSYVSELNRNMVRIQSGDAAEHRSFFEKQSVEARKSLAASETALRAVEESTGVVEIGAQAQQTLIEETNLRAQIASREARPIPWPNS